MKKGTNPILDQLRKLERIIPITLRPWEDGKEDWKKDMKADTVLECGWGKLIFGQTFSCSEKLAREIMNETPGKRNIALYIRDPHVVLAAAPHKMFLDPSHMYRLWFDGYKRVDLEESHFSVRAVSTPEDLKNVNKMLAFRQMTQVDGGFMTEKAGSGAVTYFLMENAANKRPMATAMAVDHKIAFNDPENGSSLWALAVDPNSEMPGLGEHMVRHVIQHFMALSRDFLDLSVMHNNKPAIALYEKLGFERISVFSIKNKNPINEHLFSAPPVREDFNPYAKIIINEARRRGIEVEAVDPGNGYFSLVHGGRRIMCRESLSEITTAIAMSRCEDKAVTSSVLKNAGINVPDQMIASTDEENLAFLAKHNRVVVKPRKGEQGVNVFVDIRTPKDLKKAVRIASNYCGGAVIEQMAEGRDLRVVLIDYKVVAASVRKPPRVTGNGRLTVKQLMEKQSRRRAAATGGESKIPVDAETMRCVRDQGYKMGSVLPKGTRIIVRKSANLHTGGTIHDVTDKLGTKLDEIAEKAARALKIPVVGLDFIVDDLNGRDYVIIEANERPGLANHEPQPTAEKFIDMLFPQTKSEYA
ncbi:MAG: N-acetylglutaminylglutamine synthetase [Candidatus Aenigmatarchaeota archaeon]